MSSKNKRIRMLLKVGTACIVLAGLCAVLATPDTALAAPPEGKGGGKGGGKGDDKVTTVYFDVLLGDVFMGVDEQSGELLFGAGDIFMVCDSGIEGRISSGGGGTNIDRMIVNRPSPLVDITSVIDGLEDQSCFAGLLVGDGFVGGAKGTLLIELPDRANDEMTVDFSFQAKDTNGKDVFYSILTAGLLMDLDGESGDAWGNREAWAAAQDAVNDGTADPTKTPNFFVQVANGTPWTLSKPYGSQNLACSGTGTFGSGFGIVIADPRLDRQNNTLLCP